MRNGIVGTVIGLVIGVVIGATVIAPSLPDAAAKRSKQKPAIAAKKDPTWQQPPPKPVVEIQKTWRFTGDHAATMPVLGELAKRLEQRVEIASGGDILLPYRDPGSLVPKEDMAEALAAGTLDAAIIDPAVLTQKSPALSLLAGVPFGPRPRELMAWLSREETKALMALQFEKSGIHGIPCGVVPPQSGGWFTKKIGTVDDLAGLRVAIDGLAGLIAKRVGMLPLPYRGGLIFANFESGKLDGAILHTPAIDVHLGIQKLAPYAYFPGWHKPSGIVLLAINKEKWEAADKKVKTIFEAVCGDNTRYSYAASEAAQFAALKQLQRDGVTIRRWPNQVLKAFRKAWDDIAAEQSDKDEDFSQILQSLRKFRKQYAVWNELSR